MKDPGEHWLFAYLPPPYSPTYTALCSSFYVEWTQYEQVVSPGMDGEVFETKSGFVIISSQNAKLWVYSSEILQETEGVYFDSLSEQTAFFSF